MSSSFPNSATRNAPFQDYGAPYQGIGNISEHDGSSSTSHSDYEDEPMDDYNRHHHSMDTINIPEPVKYSMNTKSNIKPFPRKSKAGNKHYVTPAGAIFTRLSLRTRHLEKGESCPHERTTGGEHFEARKQVEQALWNIRTAQQEVNDAVALINQYNGKLDARSRRGRASKIVGNEDIAQLGNEGNIRILISCGTGHIGSNKVQNNNLLAPHPEMHDRKRFPRPMRSLDIQVSDPSFHLRGGHGSWEL
ncbi:hypothetical protein K440DRAFT_642501 [Wilcoxina mikolae CBS 423.85]|nr:hypothetical protein K440DRAFT_642501 [Wilcoxina mikolae CBS 423.85]